ncbi:MAG: OmpA family protein [Phycisphaerae bacterium]
MRGDRWTVGLWAVLGGVLVGTGGCVSLDDHLKLKAQQQSLAAAKEAMAQELFDVRTANESLRGRTESLERELETGNALVNNLRKENELLEELRKTAEAALEDMAAGQTLGDIAIMGPKLPEPLHAALKRFAEANPTLVTYDPARGTVKWTADLLFALGSDVVKDTAAASVRRFADIIKSDVATDFEVIVVGHTDNTPIVRAATKAKHPTNWHLSAHRAIAVASVLDRSGYSPDRIGIMGVGEYRPIADNSTAQGKSQNRRVEIYIVPRGVLATASARRTDGSVRRSVAAGGDGGR